MKKTDFYTHPREMEPLFPSQSEELVDLAMNVHRKAADLGGSLHKITRRSVADLLRHINSYYSNLIEGHHTHPADVERAARKEYDKNPKKRALQKLSRAHIEVQEKIEERLRNEPELEISSPEFLCWIHGSFYDLVPEDFRRIKDPSTGKEFLMEAGKLRDRLVEIGNHLSPHYESLMDFMDRFTEVLNPDSLHGTKKTDCYCFKSSSAGLDSPLRRWQWEGCQTIHSCIHEKGTNRIPWIVDHFPWTCQRK
jgi:Fic family protein